MCARKSGAPERGVGRVDGGVQRCRYDMLQRLGPDSLPSKLSSWSFCHANEERPLIARASSRSRTLDSPELRGSPLGFHRTRPRVVEFRLAEYPRCSDP